MDETKRLEHANSDHLWGTDASCWWCQEYARAELLTPVAE